MGTIFNPSSGGDQLREACLTVRDCQHKGKHRRCMDTLSHLYAEKHPPSKTTDGQPIQQNQHLRFDFELPDTVPVVRVLECHKERITRKRKYQKRQAGLFRKAPQRTRSYWLSSQLFPSLLIIHNDVQSIVKTFSYVLHKQSNNTTTLFM